MHAPPLDLYMVMALWGPRGLEDAIDRSVSGGGPHHHHHPDNQRICVYLLCVVLLVGWAVLKSYFGRSRELGGYEVRWLGELVVPPFSSQCARECVSKVSPLAFSQLV